MVKEMAKVKRADKRRFSQPERIADGIMAMLERLGGQRNLLDCLWRDWSQTLGDELADIVSPMGHSGATLLVGVDDAMLLQEMQMRSDEILERVNLYLKKDFFEKVKININRH